MIEPGDLLACIQSIENPKLERLVETIMEKYYSKLRELPSSISGKHHPPDERGAYGLIRHICRVVKFCKHLAIEFKLTMRDQDRLIAAALLHDISKCDLNQWNGKEWIRDKNGDWLHPVLSSLILRRFYVEEFSMFPELQDDIDAIARLIERHMSHWSYPPNPKPETLLEYLFCLADYIPTQFEMREIPE